MKLITAVIRPSRLKKVSNALEAAGLTGLTATEVQGRGAQGGRTEYYRGEAHDVVFRTKVRLEMVVADEQLEDAIDVLVAAARFVPTPTSKAIRALRNAVASVVQAALIAEA